MKRLYPKKRNLTIGIICLFFGVIGLIIVIQKIDSFFSLGFWLLFPGIYLGIYQPIKIYATRKSVERELVLLSQSTSTHEIEELTKKLKVRKNELERLILSLIASGKISSTYNHKTGILAPKKPVTLEEEMAGVTNFETETVSKHALLCPSCGTPVGPEFDYCPNCGAPLSTYDTSAVKGKKSNI